MRDIADVIAEKNRQIEKLRKDIDALQKAQSIIENTTPETEKPQSQADMAAAILDEIGKPMHVEKIAEQIKKKFHSTVKKSVLGTVLFRYSRKGKRFYKMEGKPNTYGLNKWQSIIAVTNEKALRPTG